MLRWEHHPETDPVVADNFARRDEAQWLSRKCTAGARCRCHDIRRIKTAATARSLRAGRRSTSYFKVSVNAGFTGSWVAPSIL
jgi:hypothetical protein